MSPAARLETLGDRSALTEGPVWVRGRDGQNGYLLFSDNAANVIYKWEPERPLSVFLEKSGFTGSDVSNAGAQTIAGRVAILLIGSNALALDPEGRRAMRYEIRPDDTVTNGRLARASHAADGAANNGVAQRSFGVRPVFFAILASIFGPTSTSS